MDSSELDSFLQAGDLYDMMGDKQRALECYRKGNAFRKGMCPVQGGGRSSRGGRKDCVLDAIGCLHGWWSLGAYVCETGCFRVFC